MDNVEQLVMEHAQYLLSSGIYYDLEGAINQAMNVCVPKNYFECTAQMYDILICEAKENFKQSIIKKMTNEKL